MRGFLWLICLILNVTAALAQPECNAFKINTDLNNYALPKVDSDGQGNFVLAWMKELAPHDWDIFAQVFDRNGQSLSEQILVNTFREGVQRFPVVKKLSNGDFIVAWNNDQEGNESILAQRFDQFGHKLQEEFKVNTETNVRLSAPKIMEDEEGNFLMAWLSPIGDSQIRGIYIQRFDRQANKIDQETLLVDTRDVIVSFDSAMDKEGNLVVTWTDNNKEGVQYGRYGIVARRFNRLWEPRGEVFRVNSYYANDQTSPRIAMDEEGNFMLTWESDGQDGSGYGVYAQAFDKKGNRRGEEVQVNTYTQDQQEWPQITSSQDSFIITWMSYKQDGDRSGIYARILDKNGKKLSDEILINCNTRGSQSFQDIANLDAKNFMITWVSDRDGEPKSDIYARIIKPFIRTDANMDGRVNIADAIYILQYLFGNGQCKNADAMDTNDDGNLDIADAIYLLNYLFKNGPAPKPPFPNIGVDLTQDSLVCFPWCPWAMFGYDPQHSGRSAYPGAQTGKLKWTFSTGGSIRSSPAIDCNGAIYITSEDGYLYSLRSNGTLRWKQYIASGLSSFGDYSPAIGADGTIYVSTDNLYAFNPNGSLKWKFPLGNRLELNSSAPSPVIAPSGTIYVGSDIAAYEGYLYAINPDGSLKWKSSPTAYGVRGSPALGKDGIIYLHDGLSIYALYPNGKLKWTCESRSYIESSFSIGPDGTIYYTGENGNLFAVSKDGSLKWESGGGVGMPAIGADGSLYLGGHKNLSCIKPDGTLKWSFEVEWNASCPVIDREGTIYFGTVGSSNHYIYAVNPNGTLKWSFKADMWVEGIPAIGADGTIYVGSYDGKLYAIGS